MTIESEGSATSDSPIGMMNLQDESAIGFAINKPG
jgi:hypothetical protein